MMSSMYSNFNALVDSLESSQKVLGPVLEACNRKSTLDSAAACRRHAKIPIPVYELGTLYNRVLSFTLVGGPLIIKEGPQL